MQRWFQDTRVLFNLLISWKYRAIIPNGNALMCPCNSPARFVSVVLLSSAKVLGESS